MRVDPAAQKRLLAEAKVYYDRSLDLKKKQEAGAAATAAHAKPKPAGS